MSSAPEGALGGAPAPADDVAAPVAPVEAIAPAAPNRASRPRTQRRSPGELTFRLDAHDVEEISTVLGEPEWLSAERTAAFERYERASVEPNVLYTPYLDLRVADLADARLSWSPEGRPRQEGRVPEGADGLIEFVGQDPAALVLSPEAAAAGVELRTLVDLLERDPDHLRELLGAAPALPVDDKLAQLVLAGWSQGVVIDVPDGIRLEQPIVVRWGVGEPGEALITRTVIRLGAGSVASVVEEIVASSAASSDGPQALFAASTEVILGPQSELVVSGIQESGPHQVVLQHRVASVGPGATMKWALGQLGSRLVRSRIDNRLDGDGSNVEQVEIVFGSDAQLFDLTSYTVHVGRDATSDMLSKAVLQDRARTFLKGLVTIEKSGVGTDSFLGEYAMNLSKQARAVAIPSLEIDQPDCRRVAHSSSVGPIDESQLFYLESRGISPEEARKFIVLGFLEPVVARVPLASTQDRLRELLEAKWDAAHGGDEAAA